MAACTAGRAVLEVIDSDRIQTNAVRIGARLRVGLDRLAAKHDLIWGIKLDLRDAQVGHA